MPKETIQRPNPSRVQLGASGTELTVHWDKSMGFVQIGLTRHIFDEPDPAAVASPLHADHHNCYECAQLIESLPAKVEALKAAGQVAGQVCRVGSDEPPVGDLEPPTTVFTEQLSRGQINRLIKTLRTARDAAYGRDE